MGGSRERGGGGRTAQRRLGSDTHSAFVQRNAYRGRVDTTSGAEARASEGRGFPTLRSTRHLILLARAPIYLPSALQQ